MAKAKKKPAVKEKAKKPKSISAKKIAEVLPVMTVDERNVAMFKEWVTSNMTHAELAVKYGVSLGTVMTVSSHEKWKDKKAKLRDKQYATAMNEVKGISLTVTLALKRDAEMIAAKAVKEERELTPAERSHLLSLQGSVFKESRLEDGKPTDINAGTGTQTINVMLPPSAVRFGLIPPAKNVQLQPKEEVKKELTIDEIEIDPKDVK